LAWLCFEHRWVVLSFKVGVSVRAVDAFLLMRFHFLLIMLILRLVFRDADAEVLIVSEVGVLINGMAAFVDRGRLFEQESPPGAILNRGQRLLYLCLPSPLFLTRCWLAKIMMVQAKLVVLRLMGLALRLLVRFIRAQLLPVVEHHALMLQLLVPHEVLLMRKCRLTSRALVDLSLLLRLQHSSVQPSFSINYFVEYFVGGRICVVPVVLSDCRRIDNYHA